MKYLSKRFTGKYGIFKFIFLTLLVLFGSVPASYSIFIRGADKSVSVSYTHLTLPTIAAECRSRWSPYH